MTEAVAADQLRQLIERIERMEEEKAALAADIREIYAEAKANGFEPKIMRQVVKLRKMDRDDRAEQEAVLSLYLEALGDARPLPLLDDGAAAQKAAGAMAATTWTPEMVEDFIALLRQGEDLRACAVELTRRHGVSVSRQVAGRKLCKLRLGPRKADVPAANKMRPGHWTAVQNGELLHLVDVEGLTPEQAADRIGRSVVVVARKLKQLRTGDGGYVQMPNPRAAMRHCMTCRAPFVSEGPHNRLCDPCRCNPAPGIDVHAHAGLSL